ELPFPYGIGIIGGKEAKPHSRPYMASIQYINHHTCGGMLIRQDYVLTADHFEVVLGAHNITKVEKSQQRIPVMKFIQHPMFKQNKEEDYSYDIMLLKVFSPSPTVTLLSNVKCYIAGWGLKTPKGEQASDVMQEVKLKLQFSFECKNKWQHYFNSERMICSVSDGKHAFCSGDSGSPLICNTKPQGIASYTFNDTTYPQVYVKISYFLPWIKKKIKMND
uniref:trypsin n=1 Tax=Sinocyclocheilus rhinocerous TaxID=307959 RepID=A0A673MR69_9TELE